MASNVQKTPIARTLQQFTERKARGIMALTGQSLPASVVTVVSSGIVTVKFELTGIVYTLPNVTIPLFGPEYIRYPIQVGCKGFVVPSDAYLGGVSGLGGGAADLSQRANLSSLVFFPIGNKGWSTTDDPNALVLYGPDGVIIRDLNKKTVFTLTENGIVITLQSGKSVTINGGVIVNGNIQATGSIIAGHGSADQVGLQTHGHPGNNEPPNPGS